MPAIAGLSSAGPEEAGDRASASVRSGLLRAGPLAVAGLVANAASVLVTVGLARLLPAYQYGAFTQLSGVFLVVALPGTAVVVAVVRWVTARIPAGASGGGVVMWARRVHRRATAGAAAAALVTVAVGPVLAHLLGRHDAVGFDAMTVAGVVWVLLCVDRGLLQAHRDYGTLAVNFLAEGALRTAAMLLLAGVGLGVSGAALGMLVAEVGTAVHARVTAGRAWRRVDRTLVGSSAVTSRGGRTGWDLVVALVALGAVALLQNADVIVMGKEGGDVAGAYGAVSVSCKALVVAALVLGGYLLPEAAIRWREGDHAMRQLAATLVLLGVPAAALLGVASFAPRRFLLLFFSARYLSATGAFLPLAAAMVLLATTVILTMYLLAVGDRRIAPLLVVGAVAVTVAVVLAGGHPEATAVTDLAVQALVATAAATELALVHRRATGPSSRETTEATLGAGEP